MDVAKAKLSTELSSIEKQIQKFDPPTPGTLEYNNNIIKNNYSDTPRNEVFL